MRSEHEGYVVDHYVYNINFPRKGYTTCEKINWASWLLDFGKPIVYQFVDLYQNFQFVTHSFINFLMNSLSYKCHMGLLFVPPKYTLCWKWFAVVGFSYCQCWCRLCRDVEFIINMLKGSFTRQSVVLLRMRVYALPQKLC